MSPRATPVSTPSQVWYRPTLSSLAFRTRTPSNTMFLQTKNQSPQYKIVIYLHGCHWVTQDDSLPVRELWVIDGDVPQGDVLVDEVLVHVALRPHSRQLGPADAAGVSCAQAGAVCQVTVILGKVSSNLQSSWNSPLKIEPRPIFSFI